MWLLVGWVFGGFALGWVCCFSVGCLTLLVLDCIGAGIGALNVGWYLCRGVCGYCLYFAVLGW